MKHLARARLLDRSDPVYSFTNYASFIVMRQLGIPPAGISPKRAFIPGRRFRERRDFMEPLPDAEPAMSDSLPLSLLNDYVYCKRRAALKVVEGWRSANEHTARGEIVHEHADLPGYEVAKGVTLLRGLPVFSDRLGLSGKCDIVEKRADGSVYPVEYKAGRRRKWANDDVQLCAQGLCLEEMFGRGIAGGAVFHAQTKRRREVEFSAELRRGTEQAVRELRALVGGKGGTGPGAEGLPVPAAEYVEGHCEECSLYDICLPRLTRSEAVFSVRSAVRRLYET